MLTIRKRINEYLRHKEVIISSAVQLKEIQQKYLAAPWIYYRAVSFPKFLLLLFLSGKIRHRFEWYQEPCNLEPNILN